MPDDIALWTPVLSADGLTFCMPRCGGRCKRADYNEAVRASGEAAKAMPGWSPEVWENLGWYWRLTKGAATIYANRGGGFSAFIHIANGPTFVSRAETIDDALGFSVQDARTSVARINATLDDILSEDPTDGAQSDDR